MSVATAEQPKWRQVLMRIVENCKVKSRDNVSDKDGSGSSIHLWGSQRRFLDELGEGMDQGVRTFLVLKSRQLGISTICEIICVAWLAMHPGTTGALVVHNGGAKEQMRSSIQDIVASFPPSFFGKAFAIKKGRNNREFMEFTNGSRLNFIVAGEKDAEKETFGDGAGYSFVWFTEVALYGSAKALASFEQTLSSTNPNRLYIYESRAAGFNHWKEMWNNAGRDYHTIRRIFIGWWSREDQIIPRTDRRFAIYGISAPNGEESTLITTVFHAYKHRITPEQLAWYRHRASDEKMTLQIMHAQQPWDENQAFVAGGYSFFAQKTIAQDMHRIANNPAENQYHAYNYIFGNDFFATFTEKLDARSLPEQRKLRLWREPVKGAKYAIGMDPAFGRNDQKDRHCISVWRCFADCMEQVAEYADNECITEHAAWVLCHLAGNFEDCVINLELSGGPGHLVMQSLDHVRQLLVSEMYADLVRERKIGEFLNAARWFLYKRPDSMGAGYVWNTMTTGSTKLPMMESFRAAHRSGELIIRSDPLCREMLGVRQEGIKIEAPGANKDDRVIGAALANAAWKRWIQPAMIASGETRQFCIEREESETGMPSMGHVVNQMVRNWMQLQEDAEEEAPRAPAWMIERGLA